MTTHSHNDHSHASGIDTSSLATKKKSKVPDKPYEYGICSSIVIATIRRSLECEYLCIYRFQSLDFMDVL